MGIVLTPTAIGIGRFLGSASLALTAWLAIPQTAGAHPHGWVDIRVEGIFDAQGDLTALRQRWRMDPLYSQVLMEEISSAPGDTPLAQRLDALAIEIRDNLATQQNLTRITLDGRPIAQGDVTAINTEYRDQRMVFGFTLPLAEPQGLAGHTLRYRVFDPTYYIEMLHEADAEGTAPLPDALQLRDAPPGCTTRIVAADPDPDKVMEAAMLDKTQQGEPNLGRFFAETGEIACPD
ncbi:DUF1007 family protein [Halomonas coralii]|nr:DUF1007 family protein [Modicisalibacter sp. R2A 31.J]MBZ9575649.1 DUF1007 family protein [Modicisalibacter sp. MOD 31.J]